MKHFKVKITTIKTGYIEIFADSEDDAILKIHKQGVFDSTIDVLEDNVYVNNLTELI
jgi:hypothetical protein